MDKRKDLCMTCKYNPDGDNENGSCGCLYSYGGVTKMTKQEPYRTLACDNYEAGEPLPYGWEPGQAG